MEIERAAAGASIDAPAGIHIVPAAVDKLGGDEVLYVTMFKDTTGDPDRVILVTRLSTSTIAVIEYKRLGEAWVFDSADCARDSSITLTVTANATSRTSAFAIDDPAGSGDRVLFFSTLDASQAPDTFEMNSIVLTPGATSLTASAVTIAGANQPADADSVSVVHIPLSTTRVMGIKEDDAHFADVTESGGTYTFTYTDAKVLAIDTTISITGDYAGILIGSQVMLMRGGQTPTATNAWELTAAAVLVESFEPFAAGGLGALQTVTPENFGAISAIGGQFAVAVPFGGGGASGDVSSYLISTFPLDDI